jgi:hypothetical protein
MRKVKHWIVFGMEIPEEFVALRVFFSSPPPVRLQINTFWRYYIFKAVRIHIVPIVKIPTKYT